MQANIDQQREQFRQRKLKLLESQGGAPPPVDAEEGGEPERSDSYRNFTPNRAQERESGGGYGGHGGYGYRGGRGGGSGGGYGYGNQGEGWQEGRRTHDQGQYNASSGAGRGDFRGGRGRGRGAPRGGGSRQSTGDSQRPTGQNQGAVKAQQTPKVPDAKDETSFPALGDKQKGSVDTGSGSQQEVKATSTEGPKEASE